MGHFPEEPDVRLLRGGRKVQLLKDFSYRADDGTIYIAPAGRIADGASIPKLFWRVIGPPLTGKYRYASIIHDIQCQDKALPHITVHSLFYEMMVAESVGALRAKAMWWGVSNFGPRW